MFLFLHPLPEKSRPGRIRRLGRILAVGLVLVLSACQQKEKTKTAASWLPAWDSIAYAPRRLTGLPDTGADSLFAVFDTMEAADSLAQDTQAVRPGHPEDTVRIGDLFDTNFVFPPDPVAVTPYAFDDAYRDDTLFRKAYGNGLFEQEHPCVESWVISGDFPHPSLWLRSGMTAEAIRAALGTPFLQQPRELRYRWQGRARPDSTGGDSTTRYESMRFYFLRDSLYAVLLQRSKPCF